MNSSEAQKWKTTKSSAKSTHIQTEQEKVHIKVTKSGRITKGEKYIYIFFSIILILVSTYIVSYSAKTDTMNRELQSFEEKITNQQYLNEGLTFEVKELSQPERITRIAKEKGLKIQDAQVKTVKTVKD